MADISGGSGQFVLEENVIYEIPITDGFSNLGPYLIDKYKQVRTDAVEVLGREYYVYCSRRYPRLLFCEEWVQNDRQTYDRDIKLHCRVILPGEDIFDQMIAYSAGSTWSSLRSFYGLTDIRDIRDRAGLNLRRVDFNYIHYAYERQYRDPLHDRIYDIHWRRVDGGGEGKEEFNEFFRRVDRMVAPSKKRRREGAPAVGQRWREPGVTRDYIIVDKEGTRQQLMVLSPPMNLVYPVSNTGLQRNYRYVSNDYCPGARFNMNNVRIRGRNQSVVVEIVRYEERERPTPPAPMRFPSRLSAPDPSGSDEESAGAGGPASGSGTSRSGAASSSSSSPAPTRGKKRKRSVETVTRKIPSAVYKAATSGDVKAIEKMIKEENLDINERFVARSESGQFILVEAIYDRRVELVEFLLKNGANTEIVFNAMGRTVRPLELVVRLVTENGPDPKRQKIIDLLLEYGADTRRAIKIAERHERKARLDEPYPLLLQLLRYGPRDGVSECPICFEPLSAHGVRDSFIKLSCGHMFHRACIQPVSNAAYGGTFPCPMCRVEIRKSELEGDGARYVAASLKKDGTIVYKLRQDLKF